MRKQFIFVLAIGIVAINSNVGKAGDIEFSRDIRAVLSDKCFLCHGPDEANREADLPLDIRAEAMAAEALSPGDVASSAILARITSSDPDLVLTRSMRGRDVQIPMRFQS